ncbi:MAG: hypothetical protein ABR613_06065 [Actinomycetota bacterium]
MVRVIPWLVAQTPSPSASFVVDPPPAGPAETVGAVAAILLALAAGILGYRIIRGGRGL